jgi:sterol 3beta-glucosyltransferase
MIKISILVAGTMGDLLPFICLGRQLVVLGYRVCLVTHAPYRLRIEEAGLECAPIEMDVQEVLQSEDGLALMEAGRSDLSSFLSLKILQTYLAEILNKSWEACQHSDCIIYASPLMQHGFHIAERLNIPSILASVNPPMTPTRRFFSPYLPRFDFPLGGMYNVASHLIAEQASWQFLRSEYNNWRVKTLGLPTLAFGAFSQRRSKSLELYGYSPTIYPIPDDWSDRVHVTGFWFPEPNRELWQPPPELLKFLEADSPPIYIGFGSMTLRHPKAFLELLLAAVKHSGQRAIINSGWAGLASATLSPNVLLLKWANFDWLFPRIAGAVYHGGSGSCGYCLRYGVPSQIVPFVLDQFAFGKRLAQMGVALPPVPYKRLSVACLSEALGALATNQQLRDRTRRISEQVVLEPGVRGAAEAAHKYLQESRFLLHSKAKL